jgi:acetate kinase
MGGSGSRIRILVVNAGSSSLKLRLLDAEDVVVGSSDLPALGGDVDRAAVREAISAFGPIDAVGHRVVHGGTAFSSAVPLTGEVRAQLAALTDLAPLHQPASLAAVDIVHEVLPDIPAVACFDTAFHATLPAPAATYALPAEWRRRWDLRRFGFHGLSHAYAARRAAELLGRPATGLRLVTCHLGAGASLAAVRDGHSVDTTMGFTPLEGLVMATRSGSVDPGLVLWLQEHGGLSGAELAAALEHRSGLLGLAGTADMREVLAAEAAGRPEAHLAVEVYLHRLRGSIAAMAAGIGGFDALVFTGGVGEGSAEIRARAVEGLAFLGLAIDRERNVAGDDDREIGREELEVRALVIRAREDLEIARQVREVLTAAVS